MATPVIMPRQGQSVESCIISKWFIKKGDRVKEGDLLFSYETDKAAFEEESKVSGVVLELYFNEGDDVPVLTNVCIIGEEGEDISAFTVSGDVSHEQEKGREEIPEKTQPVKEGLSDEVGNAKAAEEIFISPRAKNLAEKTGVDTRFAVPTGPNGRIIERDVREAQQQGYMVTAGAKESYINAEKTISGAGLGGRVTTQDIDMIKDMVGNPVDTKKAEKAEGEYQDVKISNIRKVIARTMHESLTQMAQLTLNASFDATEIIRFRQELKGNAEKMGLSNITLNDILIYAASRVLLYHKDLNAHFLGDTIRNFNTVHMGVAIDTDRGLMVPTMFNASMKSLNEISIETKALAKECQKGTISPDKLKDGTFTITNLGALGIESFTPVINPPQTAILGVNTIEQKCRDKNGVIDVYSSMSLSLTFDHRAVDGAPAARFLKDLKEHLEHFILLLAR